MLAPTTTIFDINLSNFLLIIDYYTILPQLENGYTFYAQTLLLFEQNKIF